jgi:hypothetical protein
MSPRPALKCAACGHERTDAMEPFYELVRLENYYKRRAIVLCRQCGAWVQAIAASLRSATEATVVELAL